MALAEGPDGALFLRPQPRTPYPTPGALSPTWTMVELKLHWTGDGHHALRLIGQGERAQGSPPPTTGSFRGVAPSPGSTADGSVQRWCQLPPPPPWVAGKGKPGAEEMDGSRECLWDRTE